jgi:beta-carotene ketolase (CrtW type)
VVLKKDYIGISIAIIIILAWLTHLYYCLTIEEIKPIHLLNLWFQSFLCTGLFITAHDSMHSSLAPNFKRTNDFLGALAIFLYAAFSYKKLKVNHFKHHDHPATFKDPDYTNKTHEGFFAWLLNFVKNYYGLREFLLMHIHVIVVYLISGSLLKLFVFFAIPSWLSALQLFYFGTFLPHRNFDQSVELKARSNSFPVSLSFLTCYHFGYHKEHHLKPHAAWWELPALRKLNL